ncbi:protein Daple-like [Cucurbita pepo subsp. pepo]|uniref:protein Daple-like n=1 Tax=Cucurbita pepo subsp. pepo TaxID=3664 RepID=UPI000C9D946E|nr:protein Daple-like [Cucurbita pepo subsp. pepo]XP_023528811.1 protein Daple-like [Cucurbita pepo subsp. pepo]
MKKFFLRSFGNGYGKNDSVHPSSTDDSEAYWEHPLGSRMGTSIGDKAGSSPQRSKDLPSKFDRQIDDNERSCSRPKLRRTQSLSSAAFRDQGQINFDGLIDPSRSTGNASSRSKRQHEQSSRCQSPSREMQFKVKQTELPNDYTSGSVRPCSRTCYDSSGNSTTSSSIVSNRVLDRYIDGEQHQEINGSKNKYSQRNNGWRPPRAQCLPPSSTTASIKDNPRSYSSRETRSSLSRFLSEDGEYGFGNDSPRSAMTVVDRLSQQHVVPRGSYKELGENIPITVADTYSRSLNGCFDPNADLTKPCFPTDEPGETDGELQKKAKEAEERIMFLSEELEQERLVQYSKFDVSDLIQIIKNLTGERFALALEVSSLLQSRIGDRTCAREELRQANEELESRTQKLEKEKTELQVGLEKELDRRSSDWSFKLEKYKLEEEGQRGRVRELAEQNVSLQREVVSLNKRETENKSMTTNLEQNILDLTARIDEKNEQNKYLQLNLSKLEEDYRGSIEGMDCIRKNFEEKEKECRELHKSITRLTRTCNEQEKTINGLRERLSEQFGNIQPMEKLDKEFEKLKMEQMRLTGVELALRKALESCRVEVDSLRRENINILTHLKDNGNERGATTFKLVNEMSTRVYHLQNQGMVLLNESTQFCSQLLEFIKEKAAQLHPNKHRTEHIENGLDAHFFLESEAKIQGFKYGIESLTMSLQKISMLLQAESNSTSPSSGVDNALQLNSQYSEDGLRSELKAETLFSSLLKEKLFSKELEVEQLQAELATAVRGNDMLKCEVQNGMEGLSCLSHKIKDLELQLLKRNEDINKLQNELEESRRELEILRDVLQKISKEKDMLWEEVNKHREKNMLLISKVDELKSKIETLEEDILLKEGQITILKDTLTNKSIDLLASPKSSWESRVQ